MPVWSALRPAALLAIVALAAPAFAVTFHVAPDGNDAWSGLLARPNAERTDGPLASLQGARDAARAVRKKATFDGPVRIVVADGLYTLREPLVLGPEDSGSELLSYGPC